MRALMLRLAMAAGAVAGLMLAVAAIIPDVYHDM
jgi:hypothetical protein